jgi:ribose transport system permease protein
MSAARNSNGRVTLGSLARSDTGVLFIVVLAGLVGLSVFTGQFLVTFNIYVLLYNIALAALVAYGQMVVVATGGFNIALGATGALSVVVSAMLMEWYGLPLPVVIIAGLGAGALMGWINGFLTAKTGIHSFIITLATASAFTGATMAITNADPFYDIYQGVIEWGQARSGFWPWPAAITVVVIALLALLFHRMVLGRQILAVGGNESAARMTGVPVDRVIIWAHVLSGLLAATAGLLTMARVEAGTPTIGNDWLLPGFAAIIIGGVVLEGGKITIIGTLLGVSILELISNALAINRVNPFWVTLLQGSLILIAVVLGQLRRTGGSGILRRMPVSANEGGQ